MDMVSSIGGTLSLFSGFSILSMVEIIYWAYKYAWEKTIERNLKGKSNNNCIQHKVSPKEDGNDEKFVQLEQKVYRNQKLLEELRTLLENSQ